MAPELEEIAIAADHRVRLAHDRERQELVVVRIARDVARCPGVLVPEGELDEFRQEGVPRFGFAVPVELRSFETGHEFLERRFRHQDVDVVIERGRHQPLSFHRRAAARARPR
jgi:hypothetical protein